MTDTFNHFGKIADKLPELLSQVVRKTAFDIEAKAKAKAPVDTGFLKNSIYTVTSEGSGYGNASSKAIGRVAKTHTWRAVKDQEENFRRSAEAALKNVASNQAAQAMLAPEVEAPGELEATVAVGANYAAYVEYGTHKMAAQPFFTPAIEEARPKFNAALAKLGDNLKGSIG